MKKLRQPFIIVVLGGLTVLLLLRLGDIDISLNMLRRIKPAYLLAAIAIHYSGFVTRGWRWQALLRGLGHRLSYLYTTTLLMAGWFVSALIPARMGDIARVAMLRRDHQIDVAQGIASIATERALDILAILFLATAAAWWALPGQAPSWVWQIIGGGAIFVVAGLIVLITVPRLETWLGDLFPWTPYNRITGFGFELLRSIRHLGQKPYLLLLLAGQSLYIWLCDVFLMYFVFLSIGRATPLSISAFTSMVVDLAAAVPIIPGAIGQFEGTALGILNLFGINAEHSSLMILLNRFISFWTFIVVSGIITYLFGFAQALNPDHEGHEGHEGHEKHEKHQGYEKQEKVGMNTDALNEPNL